MKKSSTKKINPVFFKDWLKKINLLFLSTFVFFLPSQLGKHFFFSFSYLNGIRVDYLAPTLYLTDVLFFFIFFLNWKKIRVNFFSKKFIFFILISVINFSIAKNKLVFLYFYSRMIELILIYLIFKKTSFPPKLFLYLITGSSLLQLFLAINQFISGQSLQGFFYYLGERFFNLSTPGVAKTSLQGKEFLRPYGSFSHPNSLAGFFCLLYFFVLTENRFQPFFFIKFFFLLISSLLILFSFSKLAIVTFLILNFIFFAKKIKKCQPCFLSKILIIFFVSLIFLSSQNDPLTIKKRLFLFNQTLSLIKQNFIFGVGNGHYLIAQNQLNNQGSYIDLINQPVHNIFLLFFSEWGIFSLYFLYLIFLKLKKPGINFFILTVVLITGFFDHYWLTLIQNELVLAVVFGLL